jgi:GntR family transcriptional regulator
MGLQAAPLYYRIQESLRAQIAAGQLSEGARLPSESELAEKFGTTRGTVRQAMAQLTFEGLIVRRMGLGTFVASRPIESRIEAERPRSFEEQMQESGAQVGFRLIGFDAEAASAVVAAALRLEQGSLIYRLRRLRLVEGEVIGFEDRSMLQRIGAGIPASALATQSAVAIGELALGTPLGGMTVSVGAMAAQGEVAHHLGVRSGSPALVRSHIFFDQAGRPILAGESVYRGDKYRFTYRFGKGE